MSDKKNKICVIGLDCADPKLVFEDWKDDLPNLKGLMEKGRYGRLKSTIPAITVPAWMSMVTSKDPGQLGFYGFRNRKNYSYDEMSFANSLMVKEPTIWDIVSENGGRSIIVGVPPSYPIKPLNGHMISCFLTPSTDREFTYPASLKDEIQKEVGPYLLDVLNFRTDDKDHLLEQIYQLMENRFQTVSYLMENKPWDLLMFVEMGVDRIHHGFWEFMDPKNPKYTAGNPYEQAIKDYYIALDQKIGALLEKLDGDTVIMVVSDHGAKSMLGGICINDWLIQNSYLTLKTEPAEPVKLENDQIDWSKTMAWGSGGYYGRLFLNVKGREPQGIIKKRNYEKVRDELIAKLEAITDENGTNIGTKVFKPDKIYRKVNNIAPDLIIYFGDLDWRSVGIVGNPRIWVYENDTGPDGANHAQHGLFIRYHPDESAGGKEVEGMHLMDMAPTILRDMRIKVPKTMQGKSMTDKYRK